MGKDAEDDQLVPGMCPRIRLIPNHAAQGKLQSVERLVIGYGVVIYAEGKRRGSKDCA